MAQIGMWPLPEARACTGLSWKRRSGRDDHHQVTRRGSGLDCKLQGPAWR